MRSDVTWWGKVESVVRWLGVAGLVETGEVWMGEEWSTRGV